MTDLAVLESLWFRRVAAARNTGIRLVCFPHAGGSATFYQPFARALESVADLWAVQYPGRQDRRSEPPFESIDDVADQLAGLLGSAAGPPLAFFGHSMGAVVAFEVARRLRRAGRPGPAALFVSGRRAPSVPRIELVHQGTDADILRALRELAGTDPRILGDEEIQQMILPVVRGDYRAVERHRHVPGPPLTCPVVAFGGDDDPHASVADLRAWADHTTGAFEAHVFSGGHFYLVDELDGVTAAIAENLAALAGPVSGGRK
ncbi:thioesterase II family protein [Frankia sp. AgKG'84/4]|uniref:thioesterase II family protein n=1 Tax=Frankia sp. AgKG'84/4 TaxID=573490 RepID=UPI00200DF32E|nr:alpha/beta fold hydrolase [Frankia sp. AgKG'84/4]MCL9793356.1 alpha/beta fold hydrolase [Frankia sp. AgKG'84/4]